MSSDDLHFSAKTVDAIRRGRKVEAIKYVREDNGVGLREAKDAVEAYIAGRYGQAHGAPPALPPDTHDRTDTDPAIDHLLQNGDVLQAIKLLRETTGIDLSQAKAWVDARLDGSSAPAPTATQTTVQAASTAAASRQGPTVQRDTGSDSWMWVVLVLLAIALVVWWFGG